MLAHLPSTVKPAANPEALYLARLSPGSRRAQATALRVIAQALYDAGKVSATPGVLDRVDRTAAILSPGPSKSCKIVINTIQHLGTKVIGPVFSPPWESLEPGQVSALRARLAKDYAPATARRMLSALRGVLRECWRQGLLDADRLARLTDIAPVRGSRPPAGRALSEQEVAALRGAATDWRERALVALAVGAGLRRAEIASLRETDLSWEGDLLKLTVQGKGAKVRHVYLAGWAAQAAAPLALATGGSVWKMLRRITRRAGIQCSPHDLRRTYASRALERGVDLAMVQDQMGHSDPRTTARYDRRGDDARRAAARRLTSD